MSNTAPSSLPRNVLVKIAQETPQTFAIRYQPSDRCGASHCRKAGPRSWIQRCAVSIQRDFETGGVDLTVAAATTDGNVSDDETAQLWESEGERR